MLKRKKEEFAPDLEKGLYVGPAVPLKKEKGKAMRAVPGFINWGDLAGHLAVYGTTRVGKTRLMVSLIRQCILRNMDILIIEPKGSVGQETIAWTLEFLEEAGRLRDYKYVSPAFKKFSERFNPLWGLTNEEVASLIATLIKADEAFYSDIGYTITFAIMIGLEFLEKVEGREKIGKLIHEEYKKIETAGAAFLTPKSNVSTPDLATRIVYPTGSNLEDVEPPYRSLVTFADIATYMTLEGLQAILSHIEKITEDQFNAESEEEFEELVKLKGEAVRALREQAEKDAGYFSKVGTSFAIAVQQLSSGDIGEVLCTTKINPLMDGFKNPHHGQVVVVQPYPLKYKRASDAFVRVFFAMFTAAFGDVGASGRRFPREIALFIDEGGAVLYPGVENLFNKAGGLGLRIMIFTQSFADYDAELGQEISKIVNDNTNTKIYMKMNDSDSRRIISEAFGKSIEKSGSYMASKLDMRVSASDSEKLLLDPAFIANLQSQEFLLQKKSGFYLCKTPNQPDAHNWVKMPKTDQELLYENFSAQYATMITTQKKINIKSEE